MSNDAPQIDRILGSAKVLGLVLALTSACDPADGGSDATDTEALETESDDEGEGEGEARITVTVDDGTVYELVVNSCETSSTDPSGFPLSNGYVLSGRTADGEVGLFVSRAGFDDESVFFSGNVEGDFDENGQNAKMLYHFVEATVTLQIDGANVAGSASSDALAPTRPHGDHPVFTIEASCE